MTPLKANVSAQNRTGGMFTSSLTYGIGKVKTKSNLPGRNADLQLKEPSPTFYFYLDITSGGLNTASGVPSIHRNLRWYVSTSEVITAK